MTTFIEIRGGTGAGKSTLVREIVHNAMGRTIYQDRHLWVGMGPPLIAVPGSYEMKTGGLENRYSNDEILMLLKLAGRKSCGGVVLFEGGLISKSTGVVYEWLRQEKYRVVYLRLKDKVIFGNLCKRRGIKRLSPAQRAAIHADHRKVAAAINRIKADTVRVWECNTYDNALMAVQSLIQEAA